MRRFTARCPAGESVAQPWRRRRPPDTVDTARTDEQICIVHRGLAREHQVLAALADDLVHHRHGDADVAEAAHRQVVAIVDVFAHRLRHAHALIAQLARLVLEHPAPVLVRVVPAD
jgi:hypothetical protein